MALRRLRSLFGRTSPPRSRYIRGESQTTSEAYAGMEKHYREYRRDSLVRGCINLLAYYATSKGFQTVLEPAEATHLSDEQAAGILEEYGSVKARVDRLNKAVNLDQVLFTAVVKMKVYGKAGFEVQPKFEEGWPEKLIPLLSDSRLQPDVAEDWTLTGFTYKGVRGFFKPSDLLYFTNLGLEADCEGLSDVEPVLDVLATRRAIVGEDLKESAKTLWAPLSIHQVDTSGLSDSDAQKAIDDHVAQVKPGKSIVTNQRIKVEVVDLKPDVPGLIQALEYCDYEIIGSFRVPRFLLGREKQVNRATAEMEFRAFIDGPVADIQRYIGRQVERQWYDRIIRRELGIGEDTVLPIRVKHVWNPASSEDFYQLAQAVTQLWGSGLGPIGGNREKAWQLMHWDPSELEAENTWKSSGTSSSAR